MSSLTRANAGFLDVETSTMDEHPDIVKAIFGQCLVVAAMPNVFDNVVRYLLVSEQFETIGDEEPIPDYSINVNEDTISFDRIK